MRINAENELKRKTDKQRVTRDCRMKSIRSLFVLTVVLTMALSMVASSAFALRTFRVVDADLDTVGSTSTNVTLLRGVVDSLGTNDTLVAVRLKSCIQSEFAVNSFTVIKKTGAAATTVTTVPITSSFEEDSLLYISGLLVALAEDDTLIFQVNINTAQAVANADDYDGTGLDLAVLPDGIDVRNDDSLSSMSNLQESGVLGISGYGHNSTMDPVNCTGTFAALFDLLVDFNFTATHIDNYDCGTEENFNVGDLLILRVYNPLEQVDTNSVRVDLTPFGLSNSYPLPYTDAGNQWLDTVVIEAGAIEAVPPFGLTAVMDDIYDNTDQDTVVFNTTGIDNIEPVIDSVKFFISQNNVGPEDNAALGDELSVFVYTGTNGFFEIDAVYADISNFSSAGTVSLDDVTNGNGVWRYVFILEDANGNDLPSGDDVLKHIYLTVTDNACNSISDSTNFEDALDMAPPAVAAGDITYRTVLDADASGCTNLGDSLRVTVDVAGNDDLVTVWADFFNGGLGGVSNQALTDEGSDIWEIRWQVGVADDPTFDPATLTAKDANSSPTDGVYSVMLFFEDDAGNVDSTLSNVILNTTGTANATLDSRRPTAIVQDSVHIIQLPEGRLRLEWDQDGQAGDATNFYIYVDSTGAGFDYDNVFGTTFDNEVSATINRWTSEELTDGQAYRFAIRTEDDCGNFEFNTNLYEGIADAQAPFACVVFPASDINFGPANVLNVTATTTFSDLDAAYLIYRLRDRGDGTPGPWVGPNVYPAFSDEMTQDGQTLFETVNLGSDPSTAGLYEALIIGFDEIGNELTLTEAEDACGYFTFIWNPVAPDCDILTINGAFSPQTACGFEVYRDQLNTASVTVGGADAGEFYTIDARVIYNDEETRIDFADNASLPYSFEFSTSDWPATTTGALPTQLWVRITDTRNGNSCTDVVTVCVPDQIAPMAWITYPNEYQCVPIAQSSLNSVEIDLNIDENAYDGSDAVRAEFFYSLDGTLPGTSIGVASFDGYSYTSIDWFNAGLEEGYVWLYAVVYDDVNNAYTTPFVRVCLDGTLPEMTLSMDKGAYYAGCADEPYWRIGDESGELVTLSANLVDLEGIDIANVYFYYQDANDPEVIDVFYFWNQIGQGEPANNNSIWTYQWEFDEDLDCGRTYRIRVAVQDQAGNWMLDMDGDGMFDDYTYDDAEANGAGFLLTYDCEAPQPVFTLFETAGVENLSWQNPSTILSGSGAVFAKLGDMLTFEVGTNPSDDSCEVSRVDYYLCETFVGTSNSMPNNWSVSFDPLAAGLISVEDIADGYESCTLEARAFDNLGQSSSDYITVFFLDDIPPSALIVNPGDGEYVCGDVSLALAPIHDEDLAKVVWYYWPAAGGPATMIAEVFADVEISKFGGYYGWNATWHTLNAVPDGDYYVGASLVDEAGNSTDMEETRNLVHVRNAIPTVTITEPTSGFFCGGEQFCADVNVNGGAPIDYVQFQWKNALDDNGEWQNFENGPDQESPWCATFEDNDFFDYANEGFYQFRAIVESECGQYSYSNIVTLFYDDTAPLARGVSVTDSVTVWDIENSNDPTPTFAQGTPKITWTFRAQDNQSEWGPSPIYNSGLSSICAENVCTDIVADANGYFTVDWDLSGMPAGNYGWYFTVYDAVGCNSTQFAVNFNIVEGEPTIGLVAGCWRGELFGIAEYGATTMFQQRQNGGAWVSIGGSSAQDDSWLLQDDWSYTPQYWGVYSTPWSPANGTYEVRLLSDNGYGWEETLAPITTIVVSDAGCAVTGAPANYGPGSIERNLENGCDNLEGIATISSTFGMPYGLSVAYNVSTESWSFDLIAFTALNQQGGIDRYSGAFDFDALVDDGFGEGRVFFVDFADLAAWSIVHDYQTFWVTRDYGTGGPVTFMDVTVDIPAEFTDNTWHDGNALAIWKSKIARASVWQDWLLTPVGDNNNMMTYLTDPSCLDICGDDEQYAIVKMQYNNTVNIPAESLMVAWWDGEGTWRIDNVYFPSTVRGFYEEGGQNWVEFAVTCFGDGDYDDAWYSVVKRTVYDGSQLTRVSLYPYCGIYTNGYPEFVYQATEAFQNTMDWSTLEVYLNGVRIQDRDGYLAPDSQTVVKHITGAKTSASEADNVDIWYDPVSAQIFVWFYEYYYYDEDDNYYSYSPLPCGANELYVRVEDSQKRPQSIRDNFTVDCGAPDVDFDNSYVSKNPTLTFTIDDADAGVDWSSVHVDIFFVTKGDTTAGGGDNGNPKEIAVFMQTFFPAQIEDYLQEDGRTVIIPTTYDLDDERGLIAVIYDGDYSNYYDDEYNYYYGDPSAYDNFERYYATTGGVHDCVGNYTTPHVQYFTVDYDGATITMTSNPNACPLTFTVDEDGSGVDNIEIRENGVLLGAAETSSAGVDEEGEWYFAESGNGGTLYYCPSNGATYVITVTDNTGGSSTFTGTKGGTLTDNDVTGWAGPNPFDPAVDDAFNINVGLAGAANVIVRIYDYTGRIVKTINAGSLGAGETAIAWDGRTDEGTQVADGAYMARIEASGLYGSTASAVVWIAVVEK